jgi:uncharacterized membrane protein
MLIRFLLYGAAGWMFEVVMTGLGSLSRRDLSLTSQTYLWMHPIYGAGGLLLEQLSLALGRWHRMPRLLSYVPVIYGIEYATGSALRRLLGRCPWDYGCQGWNVRGLVRLDYAPFWLLAAALFEPVKELAAAASAVPAKLLPEPALSAARAD